ncbi:hypothetical protein L6R53_01065 [Myxococcota bacterium]|nr:hypothetical protein [Myxococcota bacterium]
MSSTSVSDYRQLCAAFIEEALLRPRMYFRDLRALEQILHGHAAAFSQLGVLDRSEETFNSAFVAWLRAETGVSAAAGWAHAVSELAEAAGIDPEGLFVEWVRKFLPAWTARGTKSA